MDEGPKAMKGGDPTADTDLRIVHAEGDGLARGLQIGRGATPGNPCEQGYREIDLADLKV